MGVHKCGVPSVIPAFDWRSGRIETGRVHNPHYFEFKKRSREHGDIPCGGRPTFCRT